MIGRRSKPSTPEAGNFDGLDDFGFRLGDLMRGERATLGKSLLDVQRELKIKATYIAAIENCDLSAFETQGFVAGYVRSYARYLGMDPEFAFKQFSQESGFAVAHGMSPAASSPRLAAKRAQPTAAADPLFRNSAFLPRSQSFFSRIEPGAVGSLLVLVALTAAIGYGGWSVLQEVQRVQLAPVDQAPQVAVEIDPLQGAAAPKPGAAEPATGAAAVAELATAEPGPAPVAGTEPGADLLDRLYQPEALDVPILTSRDGPIASIDPRATGTLAGPTDQAMASAVDNALAEAIGDDVQVVAQTNTVEVLAVRPSWVRVQSADGTILFEKILDAGERYAVPQLEEPPTLRAGNAGSIYFNLGGKTYGPAATGGSVVKNVVLSSEALSQSLTLADLSGDADLAQFVDVAAVTKDGTEVEAEAAPAQEPLPTE